MAAAMVSVMPDVDNRAVFSAIQAARLLGVSRRSVYNFIEQGYLPAGPITGLALKRCWRMKKYNLQPPRKPKKK